MVPDSGAGAEVGDCGVVRRTRVVVVCRGERVKLAVVREGVDGVDAAGVEVVGAVHVVV